MIRRGVFDWAVADELMHRTVNTNNHQTWGMLEAAINALGKYMSQAVMGPGEGYFSVVDGANKVGMGAVTVK